uniref:Uncharacterized protein n=1 Tax=Nelumbo nucifera TaxID=4432 RepID=A0A822Z9X5_NELNU|nr:TPA_asm: hypothetical protein HUJ06_008969 [Nelumbo nucifera]
MERYGNQRVQPQKTKKKHSIAAKAKDSKTVTKVHSTSSTMVKLKSGHRKLSKAHLGVKYEKLNSGHRNIAGDREKSKSNHRKADDAHIRPILDLSFSISCYRPLLGHGASSRGSSCLLACSWSCFYICR